MMFSKKQTPTETETVLDSTPESIVEPASTELPPEPEAVQRPIAPSQPVTVREPVVNVSDAQEQQTTIEPSSEIDVAAAQFEGKVIEAISTVFDPEIPVNIYELGLIYNIDINGMNDVRIDMTLTSPACPVAGTLPGDVERVVQTVDGIGGVAVELVWEPAWSPDRMSEAAKLELGFM
jgi:FeS assembly SUF system protein